jgi:hypothetical protein
MIAEAASEPAVQGFAYRGLRVDVRSAERADIAWLTEFLRPWFEVGRDVAPHVTVELTVDADRHRALAGSHQPPGQGELACFALDTRMATHPFWRKPDGSTTIFDRESQVFYRMSAAGRRIEIVSAWSGGTARVATMRVIREVAMGHAIHAGALVLHAAGVALGDAGVLIAGPKRAGKTTLLVHLLQGEGARFVANDRVLIDLAGPRPWGGGLPSIVGLRPETLTMFPTLARRIRARRYSYVLTLTEARTSARPGFPPRADRGADVTPAQLCDALGVDAVAEVPVAAIVFPRVRRGARGIALEPLSPEAALGRLGASLFGAGVTGRTAEAFDLAPGRGATPGASWSERVRELVTRVPCHECGVGDLTPQSRTAIAALVRATR